MPVISQHKILGVGVDLLLELLEHDHHGSLYKYNTNMYDHLHEYYESRLD